MGKGKKGGGGGRKGRGGHGPGPSSSNKLEERAARKAPKKQRQKGKRFDDAEERQYEAQLAAIGGTIHHMASDGNCLYRSFMDQLEGKPEKHMECRGRIMEFMEANPDQYSPFVEDDEPWADYVPRMKREREWGGQLEIVAASRLFQVNIVVHQLNAPRLEVHADNAKRTIHLSYHGESHYNSVRAVTDPCRPGEPAQQWAGVASVAPPPAPAPAATGNGKTKKGKGGNGKLPTKKGHEQQDAGGADGGDEGGEGVDMKDAAVGEEEEEDGAATPEQEAEAQPHGRVEERDAAADAGEATAKAVGGQCPCGSGRRYRKCCRKADRQRRRGVGAAARKYGGSPSEEDTEETPGPRHAAASRKKKKQPPATGATTAPAAAGTVANKDDASVNAVAAKLEAIAM